MVAIKRGRCQGPTKPVRSVGDSSSSELYVPAGADRRPSYGRRGSRLPRRHSRTGRDSFPSSGSSEYESLS